MLPAKTLVHFILLGLVAAQLVPLKEQLQFEHWFKSWVRLIYTESKFENILILRHKPDDCFLENLQNILEQPKWLFSTNNTFNLKQKFNSEILAFVCLQKKFDVLQLNPLTKILNHIRHSRLIFLGKDFAQSQELCDPLKNFCEKHQFTNVIILFENLMKEQHFYRLTPYPVYKTVRATINNTKEIFPKFWLNFHGKVLLTLPDQVEPRSFMYMSHNGQQKLSGYIAKLIQLFAKRYNATLQFLSPVKIGKIIHPPFMKNYTQNRSLDLPINLGGVLKFDHYHEMSYPVELSSWLIMVPTTGSLITADVYRIIMENTLIIAFVFTIFIFSVLFTIIDSDLTSRTGRQIKIRLINLILNDKVVPGVLGQSYIFHTQPKLAQRFLYISIFIMGLTLNTLYTAHLKTLITSHPSLPQIMTFDDLRKMGVNILVDETEIKEVYKSKASTILDKIHDLMIMTDTLTFHNRRRNLTTSYAYTVSAPLWAVFEQQQLFFAHKIFYAPKSMVLSDMYYMCVPLQKNSVLKQSLDSYVHRINAAGLLRYWYVSTFRDMLVANKISLTDRTKVETFHSLSAWDLKWIWIFITCSYVLSIVIFFMELCVSSINLRKS
ncbi:uncharacterized protein LOC119674208 [Teleopsis dalmanni]|uniref:uncharacterized protein LOC119674208 n=1 Tax=Teleopsis dalmanni TaxID=139649 RepID=UPI0018CF4FC1|nr:uncharacterized protein LOC119674208 [Teleopsis dalmanni]